MSSATVQVAPALEADLVALGFSRILRAHDAEQLAALVATADPADRVAVIDAGFVGHRHALRLALTDPRFPAAAVPGAVVVSGAQARTALASAAHRLTAHGPTAEPRLPHQRGTAPRAAERSTDRSTESSTDQSTDRSTEPYGPQPLPDVLAGELAHHGIPVQRPELGTLVATVPANETELQAARAAVAEVDEEAVRLRRAVKARDGFFTTFCVSPYSRYLARWCARRGLTPNQVTTASLLVALLAAGCAATGTRPGFIAAGVLLLASFVLDCTDGQLARYSLQYSTVGAWLDATFDRCKEYAFYAGLALGAARTGDHVWALSLAAMVLMTFRHSVDFAFMAADQDTARNPVTPGGPAKSTNSSPTAQLSSRLDRVGWTVWARRIIVLPIGERWALIALLTAVTTPRITLTVLLVGCALACCYTTAGRVLRSVTRRRPRGDQAAHEVATLADGGPLAELLAPVLRPVARRLPALAVPVLAALAAAGLPAAVYLSAGTWQAVAAAGGYVLLSALVLARKLNGSLDWLAPAFFRAGEYLTVLALALRLDTGALPAAFGLVAAVAYHHYDTVYRLRGGTGAPAGWLVRAAGGQEGRALLVTLVAALAYTGSPVGPVGHQIAGADVLQGLLVALAAVLALVVVAESIHFWVFGDATAEHDESGDTA
ncbi:CDP-alcohol phosphatidyltransferase-like enzyme [Kitasatospora atroaurantiaca]|uniref:CDP-alcohol phosphatidyltransferase-like enzyme n=1 Tax=Kitasatospora atroaurantiaca TaxID=285545 RepID=A0A561EKS3_9ACTN|nr:CDP-alcohol phosphatidyltransferase-like enzyme [Kitasatospora atroaurantiaca]